MTTKAALHRLAREVRGELKLTDQDPFSPALWSQEYGVAVLPLGDLDVSSAAQQHLCRNAPHVWSAALLAVGSGQVIVYNDAHQPARVRSSLAHEAAHVVAEHVLTSEWQDTSGRCSGAGKEQERDAAELAGALLVPPSVALQAAMRGRAAEAVAAQFEVSLEMATWRMRMSGGSKIAERSARRRATRR